LGAISSALGLVVFDKSHPAHVRGEAEDVLGPLRDAVALGRDAKVGLHLHHVGGSLVPLPDWLEVDGAHLLETTLEQAHDEVVADETASACDDDEPFSVH